MKILYVTNNLNGSDGWSRYSLGIAQNLKEAEILWLIADKTSLGFKQEIILSKPLAYLSNFFLIFSTARKINLFIKIFSPDVIHFLVEPYLVTLPLLNIKKAKVFSTVHGTYSFLPLVARGGPKRMLWLRWAKLIYKRIDTVVAVSNFTKKYLIECLDKYNLKEVIKNIKVISNGVDFKSFGVGGVKKNSSAVKQILFVGAIKRRKGLKEVIQALKFYQDNFSGNFVFNIVGDYNIKDPYYLQLKELINFLQLDSKVIFKNKVADSILRDFYAQADLFLMTPIKEGSNFEGFGLVYLEANACGVPCVGSKNSGAEEAVLDGQTGYLVDPTLVQDVATKIDLILNKQTINPEACIDWAKQNDVSVKIKELLEIYKK